MNNGQRHMLETDPPNMPLVEALLKLSAQGRSSWHMPAHGGGMDFPVWLREHLASIDATELPLTGDINCAAGPAGQAMNLAATSFGAGLTRFITSGSTTALQIMLALAVGRGGTLLLPRCVHLSTVHAIAILDIKPVWIDTGTPLPEHYRPFSLLPQVSAAQVEASLQLHPDCSAVIITAPDYYGFSPDLTAIADIVHAHGKLLLVDEAHGAHLTFSPALPCSALQAGADACVQSGHKTLPVLTPGALLHLSKDALSAGRLDAERLASLVPVFQTSSPSFSVASTLDYARAWMDQFGEGAIKIQLGHLEEFKASLPAGISCLSSADLHHSAYYHDPLRLVLASSETGIAIPAHRLADSLTAEGIDIEFADLSRLVLIPSLKQPEDGWQRLAAALSRLLPEKDVLPPDNALTALEDEWRSLLSSNPQQAQPPGDVLFGKFRLRRIKLADSAGLICARPIFPYPPGIPLVWPGERIDDLRVDFLRRLSENNISINGIDQDSTLVLA